MAEDKIPDGTSAAKLGAWVGVAGAVLTIALTVWNVHTKDRIDATEERLKARETELHERAQVVEESKEQVARYAWVRSLFRDLKARDVQDRTLSLGLIRLALKPEEAKALFAGLVQSSDKSFQEAGQKGLANLENEASLKVTGSIEEPTPEQSVGKTFRCSGVVTGLQPGLGLWLAVEKGDLIWPKESRPVPGPDNKWTVNLFEDGGPGKFSIALFVADQEASKRIQAWLDEGARTGSYVDMKNLQGARRIARIDGLSVIP
jgi:hypothetical protein